MILAGLLTRRDGNDANACVPLAVDLVFALYDEVERRTEESGD